MPFRERAMLRLVRHIHPDVENPRTAAAREQIRRDIGMLVPLFALHLPVPETFNACWAIIREPMYGPRVERAKKESVAAAVSATNACPYCVDAHTAIVQALGDRALAEAIATGQHDKIKDPDLRALVDWASATRQPYSQILAQRPFADEHAPELIGMVVATHYINRMANIFAAKSPFPVPAPRVIGRWGMAQVLRLLLRRNAHPGASLGLLPPAPVPDDFAWARRDPIIAEAFGRAATVFDAVGEQAIPGPVRRLVNARLSTWSGQGYRLSDSWIDFALESLPAPQRPQARLALLTAFAPYQIDTRVISEARTEPGPVGDQILVATTAWASFATARRIGSWLRLTSTATRSASRSQSA